MTKSEIGDFLGWSHVHIDFVISSESSHISIGSF